MPSRKSSSATDSDCANELLHAETTWFHVFRAMIESGDAAAMGPHTFALYIVIKSYTNFTTGHAFPQLELLAEKSGISIRQVKKSIQTLVERGYITKEKQGRRNVYRLREKIDITDHGGRPAAVATWDYLPSTVEAARAELRNFLLEGRNGEPLQYVHIEHLSLTIENMQAGSHNTMVNLGDIKDPEIRQKVADLIAHVRAKA